MSILLKRRKLIKRHVWKTVPTLTTVTIPHFLYVCNSSIICCYKGVIVWCMQVNRLLAVTPTFMCFIHSTNLYVMTGVGLVAHRWISHLLHIVLWQICYTQACTAWVLFIPSMYITQNFVVTYYPKLTANIQSACRVLSIWRTVGFMVLSIQLTGQNPLEALFVLFTSKATKATTQSFKWKRELKGHYYPIIWLRVWKKGGL